MNSRYEILDILSQDGSGVSFRAEDREGGAQVVVRRFFPFGVDGGGLEGEEKDAYEISVRRLMELSHPALRSVLDGGVDPDDGMPFLVTEWIDGELLSERLKDGPLGSESVRALADLALGTSLALSKVFGEEAIWVETDPSAIVVSKQDSERQVTFWISPLRWLGPASERSDLKPLLEMVEELSGWREQVVSPGSGGGLGAWVNTLRAHPESWSLSEARKALHEPAGTGQASAARPSGNHRPAAVLEPRATLWPWILAGTLALCAAGILAWQSHFAPIQTPPVSLESPPEAPTVSLGASAPTEPPAPPEPTAPPTSEPEPSREKDRIAALNRAAASMAQEAENSPVIIIGETATLSGTIIRTEASTSGKSHYLLFEESGGKQPFWAVFRTDEWQGFDPESLSGLVGRKARFTGKWRAETSHRKSVLKMPTPGSLELSD